MPDKGLWESLKRVGGRVGEIAQEKFKEPLGPSSKTVNMMQDLGWYRKLGDSGWSDMVAGMNDSFIRPALEAGDLAMLGSRLIVQGTGAALSEAAREAFGFSQGEARRLERDLAMLVESAAIVGGGAQRSSKASSEALAPSEAVAVAPPARASSIIDKTWTNQLDSFLESGRRNTWINTEDMNLYVRNAVHADNTNNMMKTLDISSIDFKKTGVGNFRELLGETVNAARKHGLDAIYVENTLTERFANFFRREGWTEVPSYGRSDDPASFYKRIDDFQKD